MRWSIRYQLLISLFILLLGVVGISIWTGVLSAYRARERIETNVRNIAHTMHDWGGAPNAAILRLMKTISRAEYYLKPPSHEIPPSDTPEAVSTLPRAPRELPPTDTVVEDWEKLRLGPTIDVGGE